MRVLLTLQYLGTRYAGWQSQQNAVGVQDVVERAISKLCREEIRVAAAGRTDSGVHAEGQMAHVDLPMAIPMAGLLLGINDLLPPDIRAIAAREVSPTFHARFDAVSKTYRYQIWNAPAADVFNAATHAHVRIPLDEAIMREAALPLIGHHDFRAYTVGSPAVSSTERTVESITIDRDGPAIRLRIAADGFLRYMVRRIAGQLIEIGRGKIPARRAAEALEPRFIEARWTAPAEGLVLESVRYRDE